MLGASFWTELLPPERSHSQLILGVLASFLDFKAKVRQNRNTPRVTIDTMDLRFRRALMGESGEVAVENKSW